MDNTCIDTLVVILHFGSVQFTNNCIKSLSTLDFIDIVVVDNDSNNRYTNDNSSELPIQVFLTDENLSFSKANNLGVRLALKESHKFIFILNNDTLHTNSALQKMRNLMADPLIGAIGPCMPFADNPNSIWACGGTVSRIKMSINGIKVPISIDKYYEVDYLPGAAILTRTDIWNNIGGFPESYFLAYEEAELCYKIKKLGYKIVADPCSVIYHHVGMSSMIKPKYIYNSVRGRIKLSKFFFGFFLGTLYSLFVTSNEIFKHKQGFFIWTRAISDEINELPFDINSLIKIQNKFGN